MPDSAQRLFGVRVFLPSSASLACPDFSPGCVSLQYSDDSTARIYYVGGGSVHVLLDGAPGILVQEATEKAGTTTLPAFVFLFDEFCPVSRIILLSERPANSDLEIYSSSDTG